MNGIKTAARLINFNLTIVELACFPAESPLVAPVRDGSVAGSGVISMHLCGGVSGVGGVLIFVVCIGVPVPNSTVYPHIHTCSLIRCFLPVKNLKRSANSPPQCVVLNHPLCQGPDPL